MKSKITLLSILLFIGCGSDSSNSSTSTNINKIKCIDVYTLGNVVNAVVTDNNNQRAEYNETSSQYCFKENIAYPIKVQQLADTYIDVDYDNNKTANDISPKFKELKSYYPYIDLVTDVEARAIDTNLSYYQDINDTNITALSMPSINEVQNYYTNFINNKYNIDLANPSINEKILNFVAYDYNLSNELNVSADLFNNYNNLVIFFDNTLNVSSITNKLHYYSFLHSLELLDKKLIDRVDTIHIPNIAYLHSSNKPIVDNFEINHTNMIVKDIEIDSNKSHIYVASGLDGVTELNNSLDVVNNKKVSDTFSTSYNVDILNTSNKTYLFTADGGEGISLFDITNGNLIDLNKTFWKYYDQTQDSNVSITIDDTNGRKQIDEVISVKSYVSPFENKIWFAFGTKNKGLYLVDFKKIMSNIESNSSYPMIILNSNDDVNNTLWVTGDGGSVYSEAFSSDGQNVYATKSNLIERYDISSLPISTPNNYQITADNAYNLKMITKNGTDELFVSTNEGVEVYDVSNNGDLSFVSKYDTEGSETGYLPKMKFISDENILLLTDGYKGLKAIKYDSSYNPMLCGVGYFHTYNDSSKLAKVTSVDAYNDNGVEYVIVGIEGFGIAKFKLDDLLFKHCQ